MNLGRNPLKAGQVIPTQVIEKAKDIASIRRNPLKAGQVIPTDSGLSLAPKKVDESQSPKSGSSYSDCRKN